MINGKKLSICIKENTFAKKRSIVFFIKKELDIFIYLVL